VNFAIHVPDKGSPRGMAFDAAWGLP